MRASVLLDTRPNGHRGEGAASSFEWAVSAASSVAVHFAGMKHGVRMVLDGQPSTWSNPHSGEAAGELLERMAVVQPSDDAALEAGIALLKRNGGDGVVVAVLGDINQETAQQLAHLGHDGMPGVIILIRTEEWSTATVRTSRGKERQQTASILRNAGWVVAEAGSGQTITDVWTVATGLAGTGAGSGPGFDADARLTKAPK